MKPEGVAQLFLGNSRVNILTWVCCYDKKANLPKCKSIHANCGINIRHIMTFAMGATANP